MKTVDDLLERIDSAVEKAKIVVNDGKDKPSLNKNDEQNAAAPSANNAAKKPEGDEPIRIVYSDIHKIEDLIAAVNNQPGHRPVVLEGAPGQSSSVSVQKSDNPPPAAATNESKDASTTVKTTETPSSKTTAEKTETPSSTTIAKTKETPDSTTTVKKTETPSSSTTTAKTTENPPSSNDPSSPQVDQIHVNIENVQSVDDLLDRIDEAVQKAPVVIDLAPRGNKNPGFFF